MRIKSVLFDLDGTLLDTADLIIASFQETFRVHLNREFSPKELYPYLSMTLPEAFNDAGVPTTMIPCCTATYRDYHNAVFDNTVAAFPGVKEMLAELHQRNISCAIVTSRRSRSTKRGLKITGIDEFFPVIVGNERTVRHKPDKEPLELAMQELGITEPTAAIMIGDGVNDIMAGRNMGMYTVAVSWSKTELSQLEQAQPDIIIDDIQELTAVIDKLNMK